ncbi:uncharacterized protein RAG0_17214 [Rhynchosporium agropyri]|uniref:Uncharacterized protein n=1 Tax=Rhynchosporium agropyri TaxID=914238 RepID=A0A1E1LTA1_9HELO|nr:uncharacterized protein RAG0_17214 [Rhynchosporium agropyri]
MPVLVRYYTESDTSYAGMPVNLGPGIYPSPHMIFSTKIHLVVLSAFWCQDESSAKNYAALKKAPVSALALRLRNAAALIKYSWNNDYTTIVSSLTALDSELSRLPAPSAIATSPSVTLSASTSITPQLPLAEATTKEIA